MYAALRSYHLGCTVAAARLRMQAARSQGDQTRLVSELLTEIESARALLGGNGAALARCVRSLELIAKRAIIYPARPQVDDGKKAATEAKAAERKQRAREDVERISGVRQTAVEL